MTVCNFKNLFHRLGQSDQIKGYLNKMNDSLDLIKRCFVILGILGFLSILKELSKSTYRYTLI